MIRYFRRVGRALFGREPIWLDGSPIKMLMAQGFSWEEALRIRSTMNTASALEWHRGGNDIYDVRLQARKMFATSQAAAGVDILTDAA